MQWKEFFAGTGQNLFHETGVLWLGGREDVRVRQTAETLARCGVVFEKLERRELERRYPQIGLDEIESGLLEPHSGVLLARRCVAGVVEGALRKAVDYRVAQCA